MISVIIWVTKMVGLVQLTGHDGCWGHGYNFHFGKMEDVPVGSYGSFYYHRMVVFLYFCLGICFSHIFGGLWNFQ